ncbi:trypsin-like serine protease [Kitasatospora sp. NPDC101801]|uniref:trypsin-like serine protease n=1 Tax=Kitasatospora sp. NPDC101801 TaxID=3364103 RepID=UPI00380257A8
MTSTNARALWTTGLLTAVVAGSFTATTAQALEGNTTPQGTSAFTAKIDIGDGKRSCTGALVDPNWVITASSCFTDDPAQATALRAGAPALKTIATIGRADLTTTTGHVTEITSLVPRADRDLVMARLATPVNGITPLAVASAAPTAGESLRVSGYGRTKSEWVPNQLHTAAFNLTGVQATAVDIVGATPAGATVCKGDTGAPAIRETNGRTELAAIVSTSWQKGCLGSGETRDGARTSRVDDLASWILDVRSTTVEVKPGTHLFAIGSEGSTYGLDVNYATGVWGTSWKRLDGTNLKAITSVTTGSTVRLYAVGADGHVYTRDGVTGGYWGAWMEVPGGLTGAKAITASVTGGTNVHLQVIGADGMYNQDANYATGNWSPAWTKMDSTNLKAITSAVTGNTAHIYAVNEDSKVYTRDANYDVGWGSWVEVPGGLTGAKAITASVTPGSSVHVQVIGTGGIYNQDANYASTGWTTWTKMDSTNLKAITSTATGNTAHIYAVNENTQLYTRDANYSVGWGNWADVPGGAAGLKGITATTSG